MRSENVRLIRIRAEEGSDALIATVPTGMSMSTAKLLVNATIKLVGAAVISDANIDESDHADSVYDLLIEKLETLGFGLDGNGLEIISAISYHDPGSMPAMSAEEQQAIDAWDAKTAMSAAIKRAHRA